MVFAGVPDPWDAAALLYDRVPHGVVWPACLPADGHCWPGIWYLACLWALGMSAYVAARAAGSGLRMTVRLPVICLAVLASAAASVPLWDAGAHAGLDAWTSIYLQYDPGLHLAHICGSMGIKNQWPCLESRVIGGLWPDMPSICMECAVGLFLAAAKIVAAMPHIAAIANLLAAHGLQAVTMLTLSLYGISRLSTSCTTARMSARLLAVLLILITTTILPGLTHVHDADSCIYVDVHYQRQLDPPPECPGAGYAYFDLSMGVGEKHVRISVHMIPSALILGALIWYVLFPAARLLNILAWGQCYSAAPASWPALLLDALEALAGLLLPIFMRGSAPTRPPPAVGRPARHDLPIPRPAGLNYGSCPPSCGHLPRAPWPDRVCASPLGYAVYGRGSAARAGWPHALSRGPGGMPPLPPPVCGACRPAFWPTPASGCGALYCPACGQFLP